MFVGSVENILFDFPLNTEKEFSNFILKPLFIQFARR